jgi:hypothetical protein
MEMQAGDQYAPAQMGDKIRLMREAQRLLSIKVAPKGMGLTTSSRTKRASLPAKASTSISTSRSHPRGTTYVTAGGC